MSFGLLTSFIRMSPLVILLYTDLILVIVMFFIISMALVSLGIAESLLGRYSSFSGMISSDFVVSGQQLRVALDFESPDVFLLASQECPAYVPVCFDQEKSHSVTVIGSWEDAVETLGWLSGVVVEDEVIIGGSPAFRLGFVLVTASKPITVRYREVAGKVGLNRNSPVTRGRIFSLQKHEGLNSADEVEIEFLSGSTPEAVVALDRSLPLVSNPQGLYRFLGRLAFGENESASDDPVLIEFDPSLAYIELPGGRFGSMFQEPRFRVTAEGFVHFSESENKWGIELSIGNGISIPFSKLFDTSVRGGLGWTPLSIRLVEGGDVVRIGRQLIRSTERVIVDNSKGRIFFRVNEKKKQKYLKSEEVLMPTIPLVPLFAEEPLVFSDSVPVRVRFAVVSPSFRPEGLILFKEKPSEIADADEGRFAERFVFIRSHPLLDTPFRYIRLGSADTSYTVDVNMRYPRLFGFAQFMLLPRARSDEETDDFSSLIFLVISHSTVSVLIEGPCPQGCGELRVLDIHAPRVRNILDEKENCAFCVSELAPGDTEQVLRCKHRFHLACVKPWLETRKTECIICREPVAYRK